MGMQLTARPLRKHMLLITDRTAFFDEGGWGALRRLSRNEGLKLTS
jgi:hypothetical protein